MTATISTAAGSTRPSQPGIQKRIVPCNLCGCTRFDLLYADELGDRAATIDYDFCPDTRRTYQIVQCPDCRVIYTNPMPSLQDTYEDTHDDTYARSKPQRVRTAERVVKLIRAHRPGGTLLDVGCSTGILLDAAAKHFSVEGIELSHWAHKEASAKHTVHNAPLSQLKLDKQFDVVTLMGVIEHFEDPTREIELINSVLKPGGLFVIYTGDVDGWLPRLLGKRWWWYQGMHLFYFSRKTCETLLNQCGFRVVYTGLHTTYFQLFSLGTSLKRYRLGQLINPLFNLPGIKSLMVPLKLSGEMLMFAEKTSEPKK